ncbi:MAG: hypothetical protein ABI193_13015, partial [Minicystis sp.]
MSRALFAFAPMLLALFAACSEVRVDPGRSAGSAGGGTSASTTGGPSTSVGTGGAGGAGGSGGSTELSGHYLQQQIDNCNHGELWLSFGPKGQFTHTLVIRNACGTGSVVPAPGAYAISGALLDLSWSTPQSDEQLHFTFLQVDPYPSELPDPPPGYEMGPGALVTKSYAQQGGGLSYHREDSFT